MNTVDIIWNNKIWHCKPYDGEAFIFHGKKFGGLWGVIDVENR